MDDEDGVVVVGNVVDPSDEYLFVPIAAEFIKVDAVGAAAVVLSRVLDSVEVVEEEG
jgi:hypothetical protein